MKTEEDEAFDELARKQGAWGGGFQAKRRMAADKLWDKPSVAFDEWWNGDNDDSTNPFRLESGAYWAWAGWKAALAQPAQEPVAWMYQCTADNSGPVLLRHRTNWAESGSGLWIETPLYTAPPQPVQPAPGYCKNCKDYTIEELLYAQPAQEPVNLLEARRIAAEYGTPDSQVDNGNLYFALSKCLEHIDAQPAQEPDMLTIVYQNGYHDNKQAALAGREPVDIASIIACREMLDAQPVPARVQYMTEDDDDIQDYKKPWVNLTDDEIALIHASHPQEFARALIAKLKERNS